MNPNNLRGLCEAYSAVYNDELRDELEEMADEFSGIENLTDEEIDTIVEETIDEMIEEGYEFGEVEEILEGVLLEMNPYAPAGSKAARKYNKSTTASKKGAERSAARAATVAKVKGAVKSALGKAKEAGKSAKFNLIDKPVAAYATKRNLHPAAAMAARSKDPEKRRGLRAKVVADIKGRIKKKVAQAQVGAYGAARKAGQAASDVAGRAKQSAKNAVTRTARNVKGAVGKTARAVASGAGKIASKLGEEVDVYDIVISHLLDEGYADTYESAEWLMANELDAEDIDAILNEKKYDRDEKLPGSGKTPREKMERQRGKHGANYLLRGRETKDRNDQARTSHFNRATTMDTVKAAQDAGEEPSKDPKWKNTIAARRRPRSKGEVPNERPGGLRAGNTKAGGHRTLVKKNN
jgi:hypothetical protein